MKITRLDKITENFVTMSTQKKVDEQVLYVLQDISTTLAMLYDKLVGDNEEINIAYPPTDKEKAEPIQYEDVLKMKPNTNLYFDHIELPEGYDVVFEEYDSVTNESLFYAFVNHSVRFPMSKYNKEWRLWTKKPTQEERNELKWQK